jgi:hypothetical protein
LLQCTTTEQQQQDYDEQSEKMVTIIVVMWTTSQDYDQQSFTNDLPSKIYPITMSDDFHPWVVETEH